MSSFIPYYVYYVHALRTAHRTKLFVMTDRSVRCYYDLRTNYTRAPNVAQYVLLHALSTLREAPAENLLSFSAYYDRRYIDLFLSSAPTPISCTTLQISATLRSEKIAATLSYNPCLSVRSYACMDHLTYFIVYCSAFHCMRCKHIALVHGAQHREPQQGINRVLLILEIRSVFPDSRRTFPIMAY